MMFRRERLRWALQKRRKLLTVWGLLLLLALYGAFQQRCGGSFSTVSCQALFDKIIVWGALCLILVILLLLLFVFFQRRRNSARLQDESFGSQPGRYDGQVVHLIGHVDYVFSLRASQVFKRRVTDLFRTLTFNSDQANRNLHQSFLISGPELLAGHCVRVDSNIKFGKLPIKKGVWVDVQGVYRHDRAKKKGLFGAKLTYYGRIHYTHEPKGHINILKGKPQDFLKEKR